GRREEQVAVRPAALLRRLDPDRSEPLGDRPGALVGGEDALAFRHESLRSLVELVHRASLPYPPAVIATTRSVAQSAPSHVSILSTRKKRERWWEVIRVLVVDDHAVVRAGLRMLIDAEEDMETVAEAGTVREAVFEARSASPDLVLMDVTMPGE